MIFTVITIFTIIITVITITDVQMNDISIVTIEAISIRTKSFYSPHVWKQIRLNLKKAFHCVEKANHLVKNQPDLQKKMHELNALFNNQSIKSQTSKLINFNQEILVKMAKIKKKQNEFQNKWNSILIKIIIFIINVIIIITLIIIIKLFFIKKTWAQTAVFNNSKNFIYKMIKWKFNTFKTILKTFKTSSDTTFKTSVWKERKVIIRFNHLKMQIDLMQIRDKINITLKNTNVAIIVTTMNKI